MFGITVIGLVGRRDAFQASLVLLTVVFMTAHHRWAWVEVGPEGIRTRALQTVSVGVARWRWRRPGGKDSTGRGRLVAWSDLERVSPAWLDPQSGLTLHLRDDRLRPSRFLAAWMRNGGWSLVPWSSARRPEVTELVLAATRYAEAAGVPIVLQGQPAWRWRRLPPPPGPTASS